MDLEKAYSKIDNLCCLNSTVMQTIKSCLEQKLNIDPTEIDFFKAYKETNGDEDFCKDVNEMVEALETIKEAVDLQKEIGCPLDARCKVVCDSYIYDENGIQYKVVYIDKEHFDCEDPFDNDMGYTRLCAFDWKDYKKTWWLRENKEE
jgi:hypothetical protein